MDAERWHHIMRLYEAAAERAKPERARFLAEACAGDTALLREVENLLAQPITSHGFLRESELGAKSALASANESALTGRSFGPYQIVERLGAGGMGVVYRAHDPKLRRNVAIKILSRAITADPEPRARFDREARILASLNHPHIAAIYGVEERDGIHALVLELVEGVTLAERLANSSGSAGTRIPIDEALDIANQIAEALHAAHGKGIVHRDLKPANIRITPAGVVKVLDFGLAKIVASDNGTSEPSDPVTVVGRTKGGAVLGTPFYMSPEQAQGKAADRRSDIWSLGLLLYEMLAGHLPFEGPVSDTMMGSFADEPAAAFAILPKRVRSDLTPVLAKTLASDPAARYQDVNEFIADLKRAREIIRAARPRSSGRSSAVNGEAPAAPPAVAAAPRSQPSPVPSAPVEPIERQGEVTIKPANRATDIDTSAADALIDIRKRQGLLREYSARALQIKDVEESVSRKVLADYDARRDDLERQAAPFVVRVRDEYRRLSDAWERIKGMDEEARLLKAEAELRHAVGEIDEVELAQRAQQPDQVRADCAQELAAVSAIKDRFIEALDGAEPEPIRAVPKPDERDAVTARLESLHTPWRSVPDQGEENDAPHDLTLILPDAVLVLGGDDAATTFRLSAMTYIGGAEDNQVRLVSPRVSQRHALVVAGRNGYTLKDCESASGTFVNGERVAERKLEGGDQIRIGELELLFQMRPRPSKQSAR